MWDCLGFFGGDTPKRHATDVRKRGRKIDRSSILSYSVDLAIGSIDTEKVTLKAVSKQRERRA